ncbi:hypothetical protein EIN_265820 [Entamoeba invadens IP1]|uniref:Uncharacterized protein n=1 Tax=Entamoeba invadens IP1 TaxID=370355 RepID=A0A0A1U2F8_ENTIV|nr:hypothetical protein EIN_265820 [Entamoeba invadens IP1]ELP85713.1 hypothetical protein EIN_265820 [Entamoeba invadens IP1]|eukprot:XP_004185059.1 hypothetical protein EIN_265820 [Entamoeba invadens IP1]
MSFYSCKYKTYCIKIEVVVNSVTGTACFVSEGEPGASHDTRLLKKLLMILTPCSMVLNSLATKVIKEFSRLSPMVLFQQSLYFWKTDVWLNVTLDVSKLLMHLPERNTTKILFYTMI